MKYVLSLLACLFLSVIPVSAQTGYTITDLGTLGGTQSQGFGINSLGQVAGYSTLSGDTVGHAFIYSAGKMTDLGTFGGASSIGYGIDDSGQVVGSADLQSPSPTPHAFLYTTAGRMIDLGTLGGLTSVAYAINNAGQVTGQADTGTLKTHAFLYNGSSMLDIGTLPCNCVFDLGSDNYSAGVAISALGQVTGQWNSDVFLYSPTSTIVDLVQGGARQAAGRGINNSGQIAGSYSTPTRASLHGFLYSSGTLVDLSYPDGPSWGFAINNSGQVVGQAFKGAAFQAFFYTASSGMVDLNTFLPTGSNWTLTSANAINDAGQITGCGTINGETHAFLLTPPPTQQLANLVNALNVPAPLKNSLLNFVQNISSIPSGQQAVLKSQLQTFVSVLKNSGLPTTQTAPLINVANALIAML